MASSTRSAFSTDCSVMIRLGRKSVPIIATARRPLASAARSRSEWTAGIAAVPGSVMPSASAIAAMVLAVPITAQLPAVVARLPSMSSMSRLRNLAGPIFGPKAPAVGAGAEPFAVVGHRQHRPADELDGRQVGRGGAHQQRRHGLVAGADQHHRVHRLRADHFLGVHRHQVAEHHAGGMQKDLAERDGREIERQAAGGNDAAFDCLDQFGKMPVAIVEAARRLRDADDGPRQHVGGITHRFGERAAQIERKIGVAVIGEPARQPVFLFVFLRQDSLFIRSKSVDHVGVAGRIPSACRSRRGTAPRFRFLSCPAPGSPLRISPNRPRAGNRETWRWCYPSGCADCWRRRRRSRNDNSGDRCSGGRAAPCRGG